jgi:short-subunit dehydrogenase
VQTKKRIVIIGATSAIAEHCARLWVKAQEVDLILVARDKSKMERMAADLQVRNPATTIHLLQTDFFDPNAIQSLVENIFHAGSVGIVLIAQGSLPDQKACEHELNLCNETLKINAISPVLFAEAFAKAMEKQNKGTIVLIGSVAGDRGRKTNYVYGAAKGLVTRYAQGLQHRFAGSGVNVVLVKPGPTDTPMTASLKLQGLKLASVDEVAKDIVKAVEKKRAVVYAPKKWQLIMWVIRHIPTFIFNKLDI